MPFTHVEIEKRKSRNIAFLFAFLVLLYTCSLIALAWAVKWPFVWMSSLRDGGLRLGLIWKELASAFGLSLTCGVLHWALSTHRMLERTLFAVGARPVDADDAYHTKFANIVNEVSVAAGGRPISPYVIPTPAVNACAVSDFDGRAAIALTEGALATLTRAQLEGVVGHEAAHIVSGDSLTTSVFCALFALHEESLKQMSGMFDVAEDGEGVGRAGAFVAVIYLVLALTNGVKTLCSMFISREKEYRADALAVQLTRDPLSLAEALRVISKRWRGVGTRGESLSSVFIVDPGTEYFSEQDGLLADLFSTHPPTDRRIALLLGMAHMGPARFDEAVTAQLSQRRPRTLPPVAHVEDAHAAWMVWSDGKWRGPLDLDGLARVETLLPDSWVRRVGEEMTQPAHKDPQLLEMLRRQYARPDAPSGNECPNCRLALVGVTYEGAQIEECPACHGCYADPNLMVKLFVRQEYDFSEEVKRFGDTLLSAEGQAAIRGQRDPKARVPLQRKCPRCGAAVVRKLYTEAYPVEVEQCWACGLAWLNHQEIEILQYLYEKRRPAEDAAERPLPEETPPAP